jgi:hypothetical protein
MTVYYYDNNLGNTTSSDGLNDLLLGAAISYHTSLEALLDKYVPYYLKHNSLEEWEYGLGKVINSGGQIILARGGYDSSTTIYKSSNSNAKVSLSAGTKTVTAIINAERINHGGNNFTLKNSNFTADTVQTIYGVTASGSNVTASLPSASGNKNLVLSFRSLNSSTNNVIITPSGSQLIDGSSSLTLTPDTKFTSIISDGSGWYELNNEIQVDSAGLPAGSSGNIQFKLNSVDFGASNNLHWNGSGLLIGGSTSGTANIMLPSVSGQNTIINNQAYDADFQVKGTGTINQLYFDASTGRLGINTNNPSSILHLVGKCANETLRLETSTECPSGTALTLYHNSSIGSQVGDYPAIINLAGRNSNGQQVNYAQIKSRVLGTSINNTSGELLFYVDLSGVSTNILSVHPTRTSIGLNNQSNNNNNILIGNQVNNSGYNNFVAGNNVTITGSGSNTSTVMGNGNIINGSNNIVAGHSSVASGNNLYVIGSDVVYGSSGVVIGNNSSVSGTYITAAGYGIYATGNYISSVGHNNTVIGNSGSTIGLNNTVNQLSTSVGIGSNVSGAYSTSVGYLNSVSGADVNNLGNINTINGNNNIVVGNNISLSGISGIIIGHNITSTNNNNIVIGINNPSISILPSSIVVNSGLIDSVSIYGASSSSGIFITKSGIGLNKIPSSYSLDVSGTISTDSIYTQNIIINSGSSPAPVSGAIATYQPNGYVSFVPPSAVIPSDTAQLSSVMSSGAMLIYNGSRLVSTTGVYWNSTSGVYFGDLNTVFPTGQGTVLINNNKASLTNAFNILGSTNNNLFVVNSEYNRVGINVSPSYNLHVSGTTRLFNSTYYFVEYNNDQFTISYDTGPSSPNRFAVTSSGLYINQGAGEGILPQQTYATSYPTTTTANNIKMTVFDTTNNKLAYAETIVAGYGAFSGTSDT